MRRHGADRGARWRDNSEAARDLRKRLTPAESVLWEAPRERRLDLKVRRQHPVGGYVVDFCCSSVRLGFELDGPIHDDEVDDDATRAAVLADHGYVLVRFPNEAVLHDLPSVLNRIQAECARLAGHSRQ